MKDQFADHQFVASSYMNMNINNSYETTPERQHTSLSEPLSLCHTSTTTSPSASEYCSSSFKTNEEGDHSRKDLKKKFGKKSSSFAYRIREHVKLGPKLSETVKGKLSLGARIIQEGGRGNIFKKIFGVNQGEELLKASLCYLSTTAGPIPGLLFISTHKLAFCSETSITLPSPACVTSTTITAAAQVPAVRTPYKVQIPMRKIKRANQSENVNKPQQKYIEIVTEDNFDFWFMGFLRYEKAFRNLQKAISISTKQEQEQPAADVIK